MFFMYSFYNWTFLNDVFQVAEALATFLTRYKMAQATANFEPYVTTWSYFLYELLSGKKQGLLRVHHVSSLNAQANH